MQTRAQMVAAWSKTAATESGQPPGSLTLRCACGARALLASGYNAQALSERAIMRLALHLGWGYDEGEASCPQCGNQAGTKHA